MSFGVLALASAGEEGHRADSQGALQGELALSVLLSGQELERERQQAERENADKEPRAPTMAAFELR